MSHYSLNISGYRAILFDLDGTLLDSVPVIIEGSRIVYEKMGFYFDEQEMRRLIGIPLKEQSRIIAGSRALEFVDAYRDVFRSLPESSLFREALGVLEYLTHRGYMLAVVTSKLRNSAMRTLDRESIAKYFKCIVTADDVSRPKPSPEPVLRALQELGLNAEEALFMGDSVHDIHCGHSAGVAVAAVNWGSGSAEDLALECPEWQFDNWSDFVNALCEERNAAGQHSQIK